jgi:hypothetical protein
MPPRRLARSVRLRRLVRPSVFAVIGDFGGGGPGTTENAAAIKAAGTDFIQTVGDNVYPSSGSPDPDFMTAYSDFDQRFFRPFGRTVKKQAFFPANGNKAQVRSAYGSTLFRSSRHRRSISWFQAIATAMSALTR